MSEKNNATCSICNDKYHVCYSCKDSIQLQPWKIHCCSADCYKVFQVVRGFSTGVYTKDEFKSKLKNINLNNLANFREHIKALIEDALKEDVIVENIGVKTIIEEKAIVERPVLSRKRSYRANDEVIEAE